MTQRRAKKSSIARGIPLQRDELLEAAKAALKDYEVMGWDRAHGAPETTAVALRNAIARAERRPRLARAGEARRLEPEALALLREFLKAEWNADYLDWFACRARALVDGAPAPRSDGRSRKG